MYIGWALACDIYTYIPPIHFTVHIQCPKTADDAFARLPMLIYLPTCRPVPMERASQPPLDPTREDNPGTCCRLLGSLGPLGPVEVGPGGPWKAQEAQGGPTWPQEVPRGFRGAPKPCYLRDCRLALGRRGFQKGQSVSV